MKENQLLGKILSKIGFQIKGLKFLKQIDRGSFGIVYQAISLRDDKQYTVKIERNQTKNPQLCFEHDIYNQFNHLIEKNRIQNHFFPKVIFYLKKIYGLFSNNQFTFMVMQKLGKNLYQVLKEQNRSINKHRILFYAKKMLKIIYFLHATNFVYRDFKPQNFVLNLNEPQQLVLVDFGLCRKIGLEKQRSKKKLKRNLIGTSRYASINSYQGNQITKDDDLESLCYLIIYLLKGKLPWQGLKIKNEIEKNSQVLKIKKSITIEQLCEDLPKGIHILMQYIRSLPKKQEIDYNFLLICLQMCEKQLKQNEKTAEDRLEFIKFEQQSLSKEIISKNYNNELKNYSSLKKSSSGSKNQSVNLKSKNTKSTKKPLIKREFLIKEEKNDNISESCSSSNQEQFSSKFAIY